MSLTTKKWYLIDMTFPAFVSNIINSRSASEERELTGMTKEQQLSTIPQMIRQKALGNDNKSKFVDSIIEHEDLAPLQTPFRITSEGMADWVSMFDDTLGIELDPKAKKQEGRQNFLFLRNQKDLHPAVEEQFRRYLLRNPEVTVEKAVNIFDQTGAEGKLDFLEKRGINRNDPLINHINPERF